MCTTSLIIVLIFLAGCQPAQAPVATEIPTAVDCETAWGQEKTDSDENLTLTLDLESRHFNYDKLNKREELIISTLTLKNVGWVAMWVNNRMGVNDPLATNLGEINFVLISSWGEVALFVDMVYAGERTANDFVLLGPNETVNTISDGIMAYAFLSLRKEGSLITFPEGKYCVWAVYHNQIDPGFDGIVWKGKIKSNFVEFEVTK